MSEGFRRPPLSPKEKERVAEKFIEGAARAAPKEKDVLEKKRTLFLRIPAFVEEDLLRIETHAGYKKNAFCVHAIIEAVKEKIKQIEREA